MDFFDRTAPYYDFFSDLVSFGHYARFLKRAVQILAPQEGEKVLELCSGTGRAASWIARAVGDEGEVVGMDMATSMVDVATKRYGTLKSLSFRVGDITKPWHLQGHFDGIFMAMGLHELPETEREGVPKRSYLALKERGRMVIADFNPEASGGKKDFLVSLFGLIERGNLSYLFFRQEEALRKAGFAQVKSFPELFGLLQITLAQKVISTRETSG